MLKEQFSWKKRLKSFKYAFSGILRLICVEHNARIHCVVAVCTVIAGFLLHISPIEWMAIALCIGGVLSAEGFNSAIEALADRITTECDDAIKNAKDLAAGAVLLFAAATVTVGLIIFVPKICRLFL